MNIKRIGIILIMFGLMLIPALILSAQESVRIRIAADNIAFNKDELSVPTGAEVTLVFKNKEAVPHNVAVYLSRDAEEVIFKGRVFSGPKTVNYSFTAPDEGGTYFFRCDVHPQAMTGDFTVTED